MGERHRLDLGPRKGQAFLLTTATLHIATSSLTLIQNFLLGIPAPRKGEARGSCAQALFGCMKRSKHKAWLTEPWMELQHCPPAPAKLQGMFRVPVAAAQHCCKAPGPRPTRCPRVWGSSTCALPAPCPTQRIPQSHSSWVPPQTAIVLNPGTVEASPGRDLSAGLSPSSGSEANPTNPPPPAPRQTHRDNIGIKWRW